MHNLNRTAACLMGLSLLVGCSPGASAGHPECKDAMSTQDYGVKWQHDLAAAREAGEITIDEVVDAQGKSYEKLSLLKHEKWAEFCKHIDAVRAEANF